jgi:teichuronic acid biosynthesis glycosyltransferase TuaC
VHIGVLTTSYPQSAEDASGHFVKAEVQQLVQNGHRVTVFMPSVTPTRLDGNPRVHGNPSLVGLGGGAAFGWPGVAARLTAAPWNATRIAAFLFEAQRALQHATCERLIAHWLLPCAWPLGLAFRGPLDVVVHGSDARLFTRLPTWLKRRILADLCARGATIRCVAVALREHLGIDASHPLYASTRVEPCALDVSVPTERHVTRAGLGIDEHDFVAVVVGRLIQSKRVEAALNVKRAPPATRWVVLGDGPELDALRAQFPGVRFLGRVDRSLALAWIQAADVLVSASRDEGAPTVIREARALNTQVWTAAAGDVALWARTDPGIHLLPEFELEPLK